jgi:hypothetical protein
MHLDVDKRTMPKGFQLWVNASTSQHEGPKENILAVVVLAQRLSDRCRQEKSVEYVQ